MSGVTYRGTEAMKVLSGVRLLFKSRNQFVQMFQCDVTAFAAAVCVSHMRSHIAKITYSWRSSSI